ncbi:MAG TPA: homoserine kinase [Chloroflexota bacterium]|nr:homoserine kinase [Chloroflexota bacterium]
MAEAAPTMTQHPARGAQHSFAVQVPATSANLGPGFDALGMALGLSNTVYVEPSAELSIEVVGEGAGELAPGPENLVYRALARVAERLGTRPPPVRLRCENGIPLARGLGSSSAAIVAGLLVGNRLHGDALNVPQLLDLAVEIEGHPDNVTPALLGGVRVCVAGERGPVQAVVRLERPLQAVLFVPDFPLSTAAARALLPASLPLGDAVYNLGRAALLVAALTSGDYALLREATRDRLHQPARSALFPAMPAFFAAALQAGALGAFLSGAGPTLLALVEVAAAADAVAAAFATTAQETGVAGRSLVVAAATNGARVLA